MSLKNILIDLVNKSLSDGDDKSQLLQNLSLLSDKRIVDLNPLVVQSLSDLFETSANGTGSFKETRAQLLSFIQTSVVSAAQQIYVSNDGVDAPGRGFVNSPYATPDYALSQITDSATVPYEIYCVTGSYTINTLVVKPNIRLLLNSSAFTVTTSVVQDPSWSAGGFFEISGSRLMTFPAIVNLDFSTFASPFVLLYIQNNIFGSAVDFSATSNPAGTLVSLIFNNFGLADQWSYTLKNSYGGITNGAVQNITIIQDSDTTGGNFNIKGLASLGNVSVTTSANNSLTLFHEGCSVFGTVNYSTTSAGNVNIYAKGMTYQSGNPVLDRGVGGGQVTFQPDFITSVPTLLNGSTYTATSIANGMSANYTDPVNFTYPPGDKSVRAAIEGIDNALAGGGGGTPIAQQLWVNATSGNDANNGDIDSPFATFEAARLAAVAIASPTNYVLINIIGDQSITGDLIGSPYIVVDQNNSGVITATGDLVVDPAFIPISNASGTFNGCAFAVNSINIDWSMAENNALYLLNCTYHNVPDVLIKNDPSTTSGSYVIFDGSRSPLLSPFSTSFLVQDSTAAIFNLLFNPTNPAVTSTAGRDSALVLYNCGNFGSPEVNALSSGSALLSMLNCQSNSVLLNGPTASLQTDVLSTSGVGFINGATISQVTYLTTATSLRVDPIYYTPSNYTPTSPATQIPVEGIVSHLNGINTALGALVAPTLQSAYDAGNTIVMQPNTPMDYSIATEDVMLESWFYDNPVPAVPALLQIRKFKATDAGGLTFTGVTQRSIMVSNTSSASTYAYVDAMYEGGLSDVQNDYRAINSLRKQNECYTKFLLQPGANNSTAGTCDFSSIYDALSTTKGTRPAPMMTTAQINAIVSPADALLVYDTDIHRYKFYDSGASSFQVMAPNSVEIIGTMLTGTTVYTSGVQASVIATITGSKTILANSLLVGESVELSVIGLRSGIVSGGSGVITCQFGPLTFDSISMSTTLGGVSSIRSWNLTFKVTRVASSSVSISAAGFFEDDAHVLKSMQLYSTPAVHTGFDFTVNNDIDVLYLMTASAGNACNYDAINLNIIKYIA